MPKTLSTARLRKLLAAATKAQLIDELVTLAARFEVVQQHFALRLEPQAESPILDTYKARVVKAMLPKSDYGEPKVSEARRIISEYRKVAVSEVGVVDLMLVYVESGVQFLNDLGDYKESFYDSLERMFESALKLIRDNELKADFEPRCRKIAAAANDMGYGFGDALSGWLDEYFEQG